MAGLAMDVQGDAGLPASAEPAAVFALDVRAPVGSACATCTLAVAASGGFAYEPARGSASVEICPQ